ncbi:OmpA/MotB family protein [Trinickia dinghuensis]|uniref:Motility protein B n=1 Tax=Trinickia dinghuensis TaxID=2291023 RepID=A0A3D8JWK1_9BURK|nr:OmpA family protein [Trinickia dinghuensis]RDU97488.1 motility protein B [Trinickia dinghuensis]
MSTLADGKRLATSSEAGYDAHDGAEEQSERWLISYADLITTLMVFFLALYVIELAKDRDLQTKKLEAQAASGHVQVVTSTAKPAGAAADAQKAAAQAALVALLKPLSDEHAITVSTSPQGVEIAINAKILFNSGDARLLPDSIDVLDRVAKVLATHSAKNILVEGHSDSVPISNAKYASNWELSAARAGAVVRFFVDKGVEPHRLSAIGRADNVPLVLGDDAAARAANRRVTILVQQ